MIGGEGLSRSPSTRPVRLLCLPARQQPYTASQTDRQRKHLEYNSEFITPNEIPLIINLITQIKFNSLLSAFPSPPFALEFMQTRRQLRPRTRTTTAFTFLPCFLCLFRLDYAGGCSLPSFPLSWRPAAQESEYYCYFKTLLPALNSQSQSVSTTCFTIPCYSHSLTRVNVILANHFHGLCQRPLEFSARLYAIHFHLG